MVENKFDGSADKNAGSPIEGNVPNPNNLGTQIGKGETVSKGNQGEEREKQLKELESLVGKQGEELGQFRKFFSDLEPLLDNLDKNPEIVRAILDGKIDAELAKAVLEGKVSIQDAEIVNKAHDEVKKDLGKKEYKEMSAEEVSRLIETKAEEINQRVNKELKTRDELTSFESKVRDFISNTPDFEQYASEIDKWLDEHDDVTDVSVAYYAVKGKLSEKDAKKQAEIDKAEAEKNMALNASGGTSRATYIKGGADVVDSLIAGKSNPNIF